MNNHTLKKLLDKQKTIRFLKEFLQITPGLCACWIVDQQGKCFTGYPEKTKEDFRALIEKISDSENTVSLSPPYIGAPRVGPIFIP